MFGIAISWKANLQHVVALSLAEAQYIVVTKVVKEAMWIKEMINNFGINQAVLKVHYDNQSAINVTENQLLHERTKHIDVRLHFVRDIVSKR